MKVIAMIPARYAATRFPGKLLKMLGDKTVIRHTYENTRDTLLFDEVIVVTDSDLIFDEITRYGGYVVMSKKTHESGSDRIAEAVADLEVDIVLNVQGDEPFIKKEALEKLLTAFNDPGVEVASIMKPIVKQNIPDPNYVKVVVDNNMNSLLFSRSPIPYPRDEDIDTTWFEHVGVYAFRKEALINFTNWPVTPLEAVEKIECLRYLEHGIPLRMVIYDYPVGKIDTPEDLEKAIQNMQMLKQV